MRQHNPKTPAPTFNAAPASLLAPSLAPVPVSTPTHSPVQARFGHSFSNLAITAEQASQRHSDSLTAERTESVVQRIRAKNFTDNEGDYNLKKANFEEMVAKGKILHSSMLERLGKEGEDKNTSTAFSERYDTEIAEGAQPPDQQMPKPKFGRKYKTKSKGAEGTAYENYMNAETGVMGASYNYNTDDKNTKENQLNNSEILWNQYQSDATKRGTAVSGLTQIWRLSIASNAQQVIAMCDMKLTERGSGKRFEAGTDEFFALLATDNCKGASFLVTDHKKALGGKKIVAITASTECLVIHLGA